MAMQINFLNDKELLNFEFKVASQIPPEVFRI